MKNSHEIHDLRIIWHPHDLEKLHDFLSWRTQAVEGSRGSPPTRPIRHWRHVTDGTGHRDG
jgi:hypothetical protein